MTAVVATARPTPRLEAAQRLAPPADVALDPAQMGVARCSRHSFNRSFLRTAARERWTVDRVSWDIDSAGRGRFVYRVRTPGHQFHLVGFSQVVDESERTDRVVADTWDVTAALVEGDVSQERIDALAAEVPRQEQGRASADTLVWTRANRSARYFDRVAATLAAGRLPEPDDLGDSAYILRSTAFYGNGKFGLAGFAGYPASHPLQVPYRAQMLTAWLLREFSYDLVEHCARALNPDARPLDGDWRTYLGLGNATGLGMVPYIINHPRILDAWVALRELPLAAVLERTPSRDEIARVRRLLERAVTYFAQRSGLPTTPYEPLGMLSERVAQVAAEVALFADTGLVGNLRPERPWLALRQVAGDVGAEVRGVFDAVLVELTADLDDDVEQLLRCDEEHRWDPAMRCADALETLQTPYSWVNQIDVASPAASTYFWFSSANNEEPRRGRRGVDRGEDVEHALGIATDIAALIGDLAAAPGETSLAEFLITAPWHRGALTRALGLCGVQYAEVRTNLLAADFLPLDLQRFQLAVYGMENFSPQSTDWLRVTLNSGAPRAADIAAGIDSDWVFSLKPSGARP